MGGPAEGCDEDGHSDRRAELARGVEDARGHAHLLSGHGTHRADVQRRKAHSHADADHRQPGQDAQVRPCVVGGGGQERQPEHPDGHRDQRRPGDLAGGFVSATLPTSGQTIRPQSGTGVRASAASSWV